MKWFIEKVGPPGSGERIRRSDQRQVAGDGHALTEAREVRLPTALGCGHDNSIVA